ncbi:MAG: U32 family peptidase [Micavibrio sp.]
MAITGKLTLGPVLFHWPAEKKRDFYFRIADEAPVDTVYLGEVVCSKRAPFFEQYYADVAERLAGAGKRVVFSSLAEVMIPRERKMTAGLCELDDFEVEANDSSALYHLRGRPHRIGQYFNIYNEETLAHLVKGGATHVTLPAELPKDSLALLSQAAKALGAGLEVQVYGRVGLALSARCYHARAHGRVKDNCQFVCEEDPDGLPLKTLGGQEFLCVNGVQTLSHTCLNLIHEMDEMKEMGINIFRLSPHDCDMVSVSKTFSEVLSGRIAPEEADRLIAESGLDAPYSNGFYHSREGYRWERR